MLQSWRRLTFLHWPYDPNRIRPRIPEGLELETFGGSAWVGLVPFSIVGLRPPLIPPLPWFSRFPETNVRTYVRGPDGRRGVYFFTLDADRMIAVLAARTGYQLPYRWANMSVTASGNGVRYQSRRYFGAGHTDIAIRFGEMLAPTDFDNFLTARFCLFTTIGRRVLAANIEHPPWPLQSATLVNLDQDLIESCGIPTPTGAPVLHYASRLDVRVERIKFA